MEKINSIGDWKRNCSGKETVVKKRNSSEKEKLVEKRNSSGKEKL